MIPTVAARIVDEARNGEQGESDPNTGPVENAASDDTAITLEPTNNSNSGDFNNPGNSRNFITVSPEGDGVDDEETDTEDLPEVAAEGGEHRNDRSGLRATNADFSCPSATGDAGLLGKLTGTEKVSGEDSFFLTLLDKAPDTLDIDTTDKMGSDSSVKTGIDTTVKTLFRVIPGKSVTTDTLSDTTDKTRKVQTQQELIGSPGEKWKKVSGKPPYPPRHVLNPVGKRIIGRRTLVGYEFLRRVPCAEDGCKEYIRLVAGYISPTQMAGLERDDIETQIGIVRNILRKRAREVQSRITVNLRCAGCDTRRQRVSLHIAGNQ